VCVVAPKRRYARTVPQTVIIQLPKIGVCSTFEVCTSCAPSVLTDDVSVEQWLPVAILALGNFMCLNWKVVVGRLEPGLVATRIEPNYDTHLIYPVESSPVFHFQLRSGVT